MKIVSVHCYGYINDALNKRCNSFKQLWSNFKPGTKFHQHKPSGYEGYNIKGKPGHNHYKNHYPFSLSKGTVKSRKIHYRSVGIFTLQANWKSRLFMDCKHWPCITDISQYPT